MSVVWASVLRGPKHGENGEETMKQRKSTLLKQLRRAIRNFEKAIDRVEKTLMRGL